MNKKAVQQIAQDILKQASGGLTGQQQEKIVQFLASDSNMTYQEIAKDLSSKIDAKELDIYSFLQTYDKSITNDNNLEKRQ